MSNNQILIPQDGRTVVDTVVKALQQQIVRGELAPGSKLSQDHLARMLGVSRIPSREALRQLASRGLVTVTSHRSARVSELRLDEMRELVSIASSLEAVAAEIGVPRLVEDDLKEMEGYLRAMAENADNPTEWYQGNICFHLVVTRASQWMRSFKIIRDVRLNLMRYQIRSDLLPSMVASWHVEHEQILEACRARDAVGVRLMLDLHWRKSARATQHQLVAIGDFAPGEMPEELSKEQQG
jgi:DNA-binding GntR family transcriptional regulator